MKKNIKESIFFEDEEANEKDVILLQTEPRKNESPAEQNFWIKMKQKILGEFAPSADLLFSEHDNDDELYLVRYYFHEFRIGRGRVNERTREAIYVDSFNEALNADLHSLLDRHITLLEWLRERDFQGIDYNGNYALH